jgi:NAD(P)-dependent dehydrogenase (short-subunit alcohol dehydrogenase family)
MVAVPGGGTMTTTSMGLRRGLSVGQVVIVSGGSSGMGRATARAFAREGARQVIIADIRDSPREGGPATHLLIRQESDTEASYVRCDVSISSDLTRVFDEADRFGGCTTLANCAGIVGPVEPFLRESDGTIEEVLRVNLIGTARACRAAAANMVKNGIHGCIVNVGSIAGIQGSPRSSAYSASKAAVHLLTRSIAAQLGPQGIRVNAVAPGAIETMMLKHDRDPEAMNALRERLAGEIPIGRVGAPEDVADVAVFMASDLARYVTGAVLVVDGGLTACVH